MKYLKILLFFLLSTSFCFAGQELIQKNIKGKNVQIIKVELDRGHKVITSVSNKAESMMDLVNKVGGISGVNGAYFCPKDYPQCNGKDYSNADRIFEGHVFARYRPDTGGRGIFGFDASGKFLFVQNHLGNAEGTPRKINVDLMPNLYYGISNHPTLIYEGANMLADEDDKLLDKKITSFGPKNFICIDKDEDNIYMGYIDGISIFEMPSFLFDNFGCWTATNLDSGRSSGIIYNNSYVMKSRRPVMDAFVVIESPEYKTLTSDNREYIKQYTKNYLNSYADMNGLKNLLSKIDRINSKITLELKTQNSLKKRAIFLEIQKNAKDIRKERLDGLSIQDLAKLYSK